MIIFTLYVVSSYFLYPDIYHAYTPLSLNKYNKSPSKSAEVTPVSIFGEPLVLWRSEDNGDVHCANDICPHRSSALSEGRVRDGKLECYYHGWQFDGERGSRM